jgi:PleD family two-component response regulator
LGLAVVYGIVRNHDSAITVKSMRGAGTTFAIYFPRIADVAEHERHSEEPIPAGHGCVLFVDDEEMLTEVGSDLLTQLGYDVVACTSSLEAVELFRADPHRFDVVITDQTMPHLAGEALARELRHMHPTIPIIL